MIVAHESKISVFKILVQFIFSDRGKSQAEQRGEALMEAGG